MDDIMKKMKTLDKGEREQLQKLLREKTSSKPKEEESMSWMYKEDKPELEDYLLGKKVDKHIDNHDEILSEKNKDAAGAIFEEDVIARRIDLDMNAKMREDPLFAIKKREEDAKRRLLQNPIKMKQLQKTLKDREREKKKDKKKKRVKKKSKKKKHSYKASSSESDSSDDGDSNGILNQYLNLVKQKKQASEHVDNDSEPEAPKQYGLLVKNKPESSSSPKHKHRSKLPDRKRSRSPHRRKSRSPHRRKSRSPHNYRRKRSRSPQKSHRERSRSPRRRSKSPQHKSRSPKRRSTERQYKPKKSSRPSPPRVKKPLTADEKAERLAEMVENGRWRDEMRHKNVKRYKDDDEREENDSMESSKAASANDFLNPMMASHASQSSVEERIKRNIYKVQRTNADLDKAFTKR